METTNHQIQPGTSPDENARIIKAMQERMNSTNKPIDENFFQKAHEERIAANGEQIHSPKPPEPAQDNPATTNQEPQSQ